MNETDLEKMLAGLAPMQPSARLESRVERDLMIDSGLRVIDGGAVVRPAKTKIAWWQPVAWAALGAAAAVVITSLSPAGIGTTQHGIASTSATVPVNSTREWLNADDQGVQFNSEKLPERHVRFVSMERHEWVDPRDGAQIAVEIPHEDTVVLPVEFQ
jgi:hypothetical protein